MLLFASDLHLTDTAKRSSFSAPAFTRGLEEVLRSATDDGIRDIHLVLLGDIFEILKSHEWLDADVRPWETPTAGHRQTVTKIVHGIFAENADFFDALSKLRGGYPMKVSYLPGNHDAPLNTAMGDGCRQRLRTLLGETAPDDRFFDLSLDDEEHRVLARHGHHWDPSNRYVHGYCAIGDFIVIDVLTRLPLVLSKNLGIGIEDDELAFAHQLDDVIPQTAHAMARWLAQGIDDLTRLRGRRAMRDALADVAEGLEMRMRGRRFETALGSWWVRVLKRLVPYVVGKVDLLTLIRWLASARPPRPPELSEEAKEDLRRAKLSPEYVIFGHTHVPEYRTIVMKESIHRYLNCGTWRRVHRPADSSMRKSRFSFVSTSVGGLAVIRSADEAAATKRSRHELRYSYYA